MAESNLPPAMPSFAPKPVTQITHDQIAATWDKVVADTIIDSGVRSDEKEMDWSAPHDEKAFKKEMEAEAAGIQEKKAAAPKRKRRTKAEIAREAAAKQMNDDYHAVRQAAEAEKAAVAHVPPPPPAKQSTKRASSNKSPVAVDSDCLDLCRQIKSYQRLGEKRIVQGRDINIDGLRALRPAVHLGLDALTLMKYEARKCLHVNDGAKLAKMCFDVSMTQYEATAGPILKEFGHDISGTNAILNSAEIRPDVDDCLEELGIEFFEGKTMHPMFGLASVIMSASVLATQINKASPGELDNLAEQQAVGAVE